MGLFVKCVYLIRGKLNEMRTLKIVWNMLWYVQKMFTVRRVRWVCLLHRFGTCFYTKTFDRGELLPPRHHHQRGETRYAVQHVSLIHTHARTHTSVCVQGSLFTSPKKHRRNKTISIPYTTTHHITETYTPRIKTHQQPKPILLLLSGSRIGAGVARRRRRFFFVHSNPNLSRCLRTHTHNICVHVHRTETARVPTSQSHTLAALKIEIIMFFPCLALHTHVCLVYKLMHSHCVRNIL